MDLPERGSVVWLDFSPQAGHEQARRRPAVVLTPRSYHEMTNKAVVCPITNTERGWPTEVKLPPGLPISGVVLIDEVRSVDRHARHMKLAGTVPREVLDEINARLAPLLSL